jgi:hypothetical protein
MFTVGAHVEGDFTRPASIAASATVTSEARLPKYPSAAASAPYRPAPKYILLR